MNEITEQQILDWMKYNLPAGQGDMFACASGTFCVWKGARSGNGKTIADAVADQTGSASKLREQAAKLLAEAAQFETPAAHE